jgi:recombination protein RecA
MAKETAKDFSKEQSEKLKSIKGTIERLEKQYGKGVVMRMGDKPHVQAEVIPSGSLGLDIALGIGGFAKGRIVEIYGPESSGKTTLAIHAIAEEQKKGGIAAFIDAEHAFDRTYAEALGVDTDNLLISQPDDGEQALEIVENLIRSGAVDILVVDSVAALTPRSEIEGEMGDSKMGLQARLMSQAMRKLTATIGKTGCCCIFINQLREKIGVMFGNPETTTGGNALKFYASIRLDIRRSGSAIKDKEGNVVGNNVKVTVKKNKLAPPFRVATFDVMYGEGISKTGEIVDLGVSSNIIQKSGAWYSFNGAKIAQGREAAKQFFADNPEVALEVETQIKQSIIKSSAPAAEEDEASVSSDMD